MSETARAGGPAPFELWPEHVEAYEVFWCCRRQWRVAVGMGGAWFQGLDFAAVDVTMSNLGVKAEHRREVFLQLKVMEEEGIEALND